MEIILKSKIFKVTVTTLFAFSLITLSASAQPGTHTVVKGDSMWKIAVRYEIGLSELIKANRTIKNPALIYPGDKIYIPNIDEVKALEAEVIRLVNIERANNGLKPLAANWELSRVARIKSQDMIDKGYFAHNSPTYGTPFDMIKQFGIKYTAAGENIAYGQNTPAEVVRTRMNSPGHKANILSASYTQIGVGAAKKSNGTLYWTQMFIKA